MNTVKFIVGSIEYYIDISRIVGYCPDTDNTTRIYIDHCDLSMIIDDRSIDMVTNEITQALKR